ncbi:MAG: hypothetical protein OHK0021_21320 [Bryobacter sp.]
MGADKEELCRQLFERLVTTLEADAASTAELREYLRDCEPCVEFIDSLEKTLALCRGYEASAAIPESIANLWAPPSRRSGPESL